MKPILMVLDDWEGLIEVSSCWKQVTEKVNIRFLKKPITEIDNTELSRVEYLLAIRERTSLSTEVFEKLPNLKLLLQTGGHG